MARVRAVRCQTNEIDYDKRERRRERKAKAIRVSSIAEHTIKEGQRTATAAGLPKQAQCCRFSLTRSNSLFDPHSHAFTFSLSQFIHLPNHCPLLPAVVVVVLFKLIEPCRSRVIALISGRSRFINALAIACQLVSVCACVLELVHNSSITLNFCTSVRSIPLLADNVLSLHHSLDHLANWQRWSGFGPGRAL